MECNELIEQLSEYLDPDAREQLCREINDHLKRCHDCSLKVDTIRKTIVIVQSGGAPEPPIWLSDRLQQALAKAYRAEGSAGSH